MDDNVGAISPAIWLKGPKRAFDLLAGAALLLVLSPLLILTALTIKLTSRGPVLFVQTRGGLRGMAFRLYKFRTMRADRKHDPKEIVPLHHSDITPLGYFLRRAKIDELPQLANVIGGSMSLVGPRPTLLDQTDGYDAFRRQRLLVRPGTTGLAQVNCNALAPWDERILYDIAYVRRCSLLFDLKILLRTPLVMLLGESRTTRPFRETPYAESVEVPDDFDTIAAS